MNEIQQGELNEQLFNAVIHGNVGQIEELIVAGAEVNAVDEGEKAFLRLSASSNVRERGIVEGANIQQLRFTPLHCAVLSGKREMVELLIEKGANINEDGSILLHYATVLGDKREMVELLIEKEVNVDAVDDNGDTPLFPTAFSGKREMVELLIEKGANINAVNKAKNTPLFSAVLSGRREIVELLIEKGANINAVNETKNTPLHCAVLSGKREMVELLIEKGAHIDAIDDNGDTPLSLAAEYSQKGVIESLLEKGANIDVIDGDGNTPLNRAIISNEIDNAEPIVNHIAKLKVAGLYVSEMNLQQKDEFINASRERYRDYSQQLQNCEKEIKKLNKPLYDFLKGSNINELASIWEQNADVRNKFDNQEDLKKQYPEYAYILINKANEVKKEIFLHNHRPLIDFLSTHYESNFQAMSFAGIRKFFEMHKNDFKEERIGLRNNTLIYFADFENVKERGIPTLKVKTFVETVKNKDINSNLERPSTEQTQGASQSLN